MKRVDIFAVGKLRDPALRALCDDYYRRCAALVKISERELRNERELVASLTSKVMLVVLDERGVQLASRDFSKQLGRWLERESRVSFAIGGADGLSEQLRAKGQFLLSLGQMTFPHQIVRLLLAEQLYRAVSILSGGPYHRD